ncbi:MAG TPA: AAA family ATPase [Methanothermobacter sp.]|jgi:cytidylate kinase|uniref:Cytidylate kinase n=1 Tax=Methanothermobacter tenebrarum TaxID=680118 RepID=A0ABM7YEA9_9EURY|nr:AAA family ATPase [Methanothermobacter tenebrarum]MDD3454754.1 AAA family ATPase [Methanobacteriales archaeon]MDI6881456.1 AAA family ATPase [Methanothermobacter sp.]MDX9692945.1 AAA family ATPase [Methanothermobacter sp.]BDH79732.1 cytidylate kinase [Methanothermobacter tenebrarum]HHW16627.1 AAA family ATPase [Methanothermobacter sp.]
MIITISGLPGAGTTTITRMLSRKLGIPYISAGDVFRQMAAERGMDLLEFSRLAEEDHEIDREIDKRQAEMARGAENLIVEGRLSAHFVEADLKILIIAPFDVRAERISRRESKPIKIVGDEIKRREESEAKRYMEIHGIDIEDLQVYDIIVNSAHFKPEEITNIIIKVIEVIK